MRFLSLASAVLFLSLALLTSCSDQNSTPPSDTESAAPNPAPPAVQPQRSTPDGSTTVPNSGIANSAAGIQWTVPVSWSMQPPRSMRIATYSVPAADGDSENGECAVFFFGTGQGGDVRANIDRWIGQFQTDSEPKESTTTVNGLQVTTVSVSGTYLSPGGPMMQSQGEKRDYRLLGAIVEAPEGAVFFKTTGPQKTIAQAEDEFNALVSSVRRTAQ